MEETSKKIKIVAIIRGDVPQVEKIVAALFAGGIRAAEVAMNTPRVEKILPKIIDEFGQKMLVGAGTVWNKNLAQKAIKIGAQFLVAPNLDPEVVKLCQKAKLPIIPGVLTPSEICRALNLGINFVKLFPASALGSNYLKELKGPFDKVSFMPVGGINLVNANEFIQAGAEALGVGGGLIDKKALKNRRYDIIQAKAAAFLNFFAEQKGNDSSNY